MNGEKKTRMQCAEFEAVLSDALDGMLSTADDIRFKAHLAACSSCAPLFHGAEAGLKWLSALKEEEAEPSGMLVENILRATIGTSPIPRAAEEKKSWLERLKETSVLAPIFQTVLQPRFAMGFGMAFFTVSMLLTVLRPKVDLRPSAVVTAYYSTTGKIVKYWENLRFVYKIETQIRDLKNSIPQKTDAPQNGQDNQQNQNNTDKNKSKDTNNRETSKVQDRDRDNNLILAEAPADQAEGNGQRLQAPGQRRSL